MSFILTALAYSIIGTAKTYSPDGGLLGVFPFFNEAAVRVLVHVSLHACTVASWEVALQNQVIWTLGILLGFAQLLSKWLHQIHSIQRACECFPTSSPTLVIASFKRFYTCWRLWNAISVVLTCSSWILVRWNIFSPLLFCAVPEHVIDYILLGCLSLSCWFVWLDSNREWVLCSGAMLGAGNTKQMRHRLYPRWLLSLVGRTVQLWTHSIH